MDAHDGPKEVTLRRIASSSPLYRSLHEERRDAMSEEDDAGGYQVGRWRSGSDRRGCKSPSLFPWGCCLPGRRGRSPDERHACAGNHEHSRLQTAGVRQVAVDQTNEHGGPEARQLVFIAAWTTGAVCPPSASRRFSSRGRRLRTRTGVDSSRNTRCGTGDHTPSTLEPRR